MAELRAKKAGIGAEIEKKLEARYDQEEADGTTKAIQLWINALLKEKDDKEADIPSFSHRDLHQHLRDGVKLCKVINILLEKDGKPKVHVQKKASSMFVAYTNIENFNAGCLQYGVAKEFTVQSADVWEGRKGPFLNLINNLHTLACMATSKGCDVTYTGNVQKAINFD